jgi:proton-dependent oligopeptide transporter, POT family
MLIGLVVYVAGRGALPPEPPLRRRQHDAPARTLVASDARAVALLVLLLPVVALVMVGNTQIFNAYLLWAQENYRLTFFGHTMPVSWLLSLDALSGVPTTLLSLMFWRWWARRHTELDELGKMVVGAAILAAAPLCLALAAWLHAGRHTVGLQWGIAFHLINSIGFASMYPIGMALYSRLAPAALGATVVNSYALSLFLSNLLAGWLGGLLVRLPGATFWLLHAALVGLGAVLLLAVAVLSRRFVGAPNTSRRPA